MDSAHIIESLGFELEYVSDERTFERQERLAGFARGRGLQVIAEVFDEMSPPGGDVLRLDRLELDLGPVDEDDLEHDLARRLREALRLALSDGLYRAREAAGRLASPQSPQALHSTPAPTSPHVPFGLSLSKPPSPALQPFDKPSANGAAQAPGAQPPHASVHPRPHAWRAALLHFLQYGHLPWHADRHLTANPGAALQALLHDDGPAFAAALRTLPPTSPAWRRLAGLAPPPLRLRLARLLAPTAGDWLQDLAAALTSSPAPAAGAQGWRDQAWAALLPALLAPGSAATLPARLREPLRPALASVTDPAQRPALAAVRAALGEPVPPHPVSQPDAPPDAEASEDSHAPSQRSFWRARVEAALQAGSLAGTADAWRALLRHDRGWLRGRIAALGRSARIRRTLAQGLDPALLHELIGVWVNTAMQGLVMAVIHTLQQLAGEAAARGHAAMARVAAPVLWEHTLGHLWVEGDVQDEVQDQVQDQAQGDMKGKAPAGGPGRPTRPASPADASAYVESLLQRLSHAEDIPPGSWAPASDPASPKADLSAAAAHVLRLVRNAAPGTTDAHGEAASPARSPAPGKTPAPAAAGQAPPLPASPPPLPGQDAESADTHVRLWRQRLLAALTAPEGAAHAVDPHSLESLWRQDPAWLRATLQRLGHAAPVRRRIAQDLGPALLRDLLGLWVSPARQDAIAAFVHGLASLARRQPALARLSAAGLWAHVLGHLWLEQDPARPETVAHEQALARSVLRQLAEHGEIAPSGWPALLGPGGTLDAALPWVLAQIGRLPPGAPEGRAGSDRTALRELVQPHAPAPCPSPAEASRGAHEEAPSCADTAEAAPPAAPDPAAPPPRIHAWRRLLLAALAPAPAAATAPSPALDPSCCAGLLRHDAAWLRATLQRLGRSVAVRRRIAHGLDAGLLRDLIGLWVAPAGQDFMVATVRLLEHLAHRQPALSGMAAAGLWAHTLAWLWLERGAAPEDAAHEGHAFVQSVLRQLEQHGDVAPTSWQALLGPGADREAAVPWVLAQVGAWAQDGPAAVQPGGPVVHGGDASAGAEARGPGAQGPGAGPVGRAREPADVFAPPRASDPPAALAARPHAAAQGDTPASLRTLRTWRRMLRTMLAPQGPGTARARWDPACWQGLLRHAGPWLRAQVQRLGRVMDVRRAMAQRLSPALLRELAGLWVGPARQDFIAAFVQGLERLAAATPALPRGAGQEVWAHALGHLCMDPEAAAGAWGGADGERAFVRGLLRQLERHEGIDPAAWAGAADGVGDADAAVTWVRQQIRAALADEQPGPVGGEAAAAVPMPMPMPMPRRAQLAAAVSASRFEAAFETLWFDASRDDALWLRALLCRDDQDLAGLAKAWAGEAPALRQVEPHPHPSTRPTPPGPASIAALRRAIAQRLPQPRWQQSLSPWLTPGECSELAATVHRLAQSAAQQEPQADDLEPWLWDRSLALLWRLPPQRLNLPALAQQLAQDLAHRDPGRSTPSPATVGEGGAQGRTATGPATNKAPHPSPLPLMREREFVEPPPAMPSSEPAEHALLRALQSRTPLSPADADLWRAQWAALTSRPSPQWRRRLRLALETPPAATRLVELLPRVERVATLRLLCPTEHADWQATATLITQACRATGTAGAPGQLDSLAWQFIFREAIEEGRTLHTPAHTAGFARRLVAELARQLMPPDPPHWRRTLAQALARSSDTLAAALRADLQPPTAPAPLDAASWERPVLDWDDLADGDAIHVGNAGLVLAGPYLPRLLRMLGLAGDTTFTPPEAAAERGVHLLQAVVDGRGDTAEPLLVLNKLLCGLPLATPVPPRIELTPQQLAAIDGMLKAMIQHWRTLGHTSVAGLRETFLQREGRLIRKGGNTDAWHLVVERHPLDVLLDRLPWGFATIKYPWMEQVLHVQWS
jgi:hypothetical protein